MGLLSCRKIVIAYSVFQDGCLAGSIQKRKQLKISAAQQQPERRPCDLRLDHETVVVAYSDLSAPAAADIHGPAAAGKNARLVFWISNNIISQYSRADVFL
jgi:hypothetical protein